MTMGTVSWLRRIASFVFAGTLLPLGTALRRAAGQLFFLVTSAGFIALYQETYGDRKDAPLAPTMVALCLAVLFAYSLYRFSLLLCGQVVRATAGGLGELLKPGEVDETAGTASAVESASTPEPDSVQGYLRILQDKIVRVQRSLDTRSSRCSTLGKQFAAAALLMPGVTWLTTMTVFRGQEKLSNLWALTFTSMTAGSIAVAIGIALMKHATQLAADAAQARADYLHTVALETAVSIGAQQGLQREALALVLQRLVALHSPAGARDGTGERQYLQGLDHNVLLETVNQVLKPSA